MRIAIVSNSFPNGCAKQPVFPALFELTTTLAQLGHEVLVVTFNDDANERSIARSNTRGVNVVTVPHDRERFNTLFGIERIPLSAHFLGRARAITKAVEDELHSFAPDVIECQEFFAMGFFLAALKKFPIVVRCYGPLGTLMRSDLIGQFNEIDMRLMDAMELATIGAANGVIAISEDLAGTLSMLSGRDLAEFAIVRAPLAVPDDAAGRNIESLQQQEDGASRIMEHDRFPRLFFWGNINYLKGTDTLVDAFASVLEKYPSAQLIMGGAHVTVSGSKEPFVENLVARSRQLGIEKSVSFPGFLSTEDVSAFIRWADICVFPSRFETACYTCLEAMSHGAPVVAARVGGLKEYCLDRETGLLFESGNSKDLADKILMMSGDSELRTRLGANAKQRVREFCSPELIARQSVAVYESAIENFRAKADEGAGYALLAREIGNLLDSVPADQVRSLTVPEPATLPPVEEVMEKCASLEAERARLVFQTEKLKRELAAASAEQAVLREQQKRGLVSLSLKVMRKLDSLPALKACLRPAVSISRRLTRS